MNRTLIVALAVASFLTACGLQSEPQAEVILSQDVQYELLGTSTSTTSTTVLETPFFPVLFYWHTALDNRLQTIQRTKDTPPTAAGTLRELVDGPLPEDFEARPDLKNFLDPSMDPQLQQIEGTIFQIQIQWSEEALTTEQAAELVCTAVQFPEIDSVTIVNGDGAQFTLSGTGAVAIVGPASAADFGNCREQSLPGEADPDAETTTTEG